MSALQGCDEQASPDGEDGVDIVYPDADNDGIMDNHEAGWGGSMEAEEGGTEPTTASGTEPTTGTIAEPDYLTEDFDLDGTPNYLDTDSDNDGIGDDVEAGDVDLFTLPVDTDLDGMPNFLDEDSDGNCITDTIEGTSDLDGDGYPDFTDLDNDGDNIGDVIEIGAGCGMPDSDGDGTPDFEDQDSDGDGIADLFEGGTNDFSDEVSDTDGDGIPDYLDLDSDGDGFSDAEESGGGQLWEAPRDTDGDGIYDFIDDDSDGDGLSDYDEANIYGTDPLSEDTDADGYTDGAEILTGSDPTDPSSIIDGLYVVVPERTDVDEVFEFELSVEMGDVAFLLDTTGSMGSTVSAMSTEFSTIVNDLAVAIPDANYGVATFDDYACCGFGSTLYSDKPYIMRQQVTSDTVAVQNILTGIPLHGGLDWPESAVEGLYQALSGAGYDENCNGNWDGAHDVLPFISAATDPFGGGAGQYYDPAVPGTGLNGGLGFRDAALPIVVYATDADLRSASGWATPGGCPADADNAMLATAAGNLGAKLIGICVNGCTGRGQMSGLAQATSSLADLDGDGLVDEELVFDWSGNSAQFRQTIVDAVTDLVDTVAFSEVNLEIVGDTEGFVVNIDPAVHYVAGAASGQVIDFTLTFRGADAAAEADELYALTLNVYGDGTVLLDTLDIFVLVPGVQVVP